MQRFVIPAHAGIQLWRSNPERAIAPPHRHGCIPAFAGMTAGEAPGSATVKGKRIRPWHTRHTMGFDYRTLRLAARAIRKGAHKAHLGGGAAHFAERGEFQLALLRQLGLERGHRLLDVGCGPLRGGLPLIRFLAPGRYRGVDANASLVEAAHHELGEAGLADVRPRVTLLADFEFATLAERFDFVLLFSVLNHCTPDERAHFFANVPDVMADGARIVVSHADWLVPGDPTRAGLECTTRIERASDLPPPLDPARWSFPQGRGGPLPIVVLRAAA
jgi:SAM-dependent methyltransferase